MSNGRSHGDRDDARHAYDAILYLSFGGPEGPDEVMPFLERVTEGRNVPRERLLGVAEHYHLFGGVSPINAQNRAVIMTLRELLAREGPHLPVYWGNRNSAPFVADAVRRMRDDGVRRAVAFATSAFSSYSGCRQYREDVAQARAEVGDSAPAIDKIRVFYNHPGFIEPQTERVAVALEAIPPGRRQDVRLLYTAHSIPMSMADASDYEVQVGEAARLVTERLPVDVQHEVVWQSRSGPPHIPWLEPDIGERLPTLAEEGVADVVVVPLGFVSDHLEVQFDLDVEAAQIAADLGLHMVRADTVGAHPRYVRMIRELVVERASADPSRPALGAFPAAHDVCAADCCLSAAG